MKKSKMKSLISSARKAAKEGIELRLVSELKEVASTLGKASKGLEKEIKKGSRKLAKKVAKELKIDKTALLGLPKTKKAVVKKPVAVKEAKPVVEQPVTTTAEKRAAPKKAVKVTAVKTAKPEK